ncbi:MAG: DUF4157 domain-containing protein [Anaerolineae bacterium]
MKRVQRSSAGDVPDVTDETEGHAIESMRGGGQSMPDSARGFFEPRFGQDFGNVSIHTGAQGRFAESPARSARIYHRQRHFLFRSGEYNPKAPAGVNCWRMNWPMSCSRAA